MLLRSTRVSSSQELELKLAQGVRYALAHIGRLDRKRAKEVRARERRVALAHVRRPLLTATRIAVQHVCDGGDQRDQSVCAGRSCGPLQPRLGFGVLAEGDMREPARRKHRV